MDAVLLADPEVTRIPVHECGEPLVDLAEAGVPCARTGAAARVRAGVATRLAAAHRSLPEGYGLLVVEGWRSTRAQEAIAREYRATVRAAHPDLPDAAIERLTSRFVAPVEIAPHVAGAAVDVTLTGPDGQELWMGTAVDATPEQSDGACWTRAPGLPDVVVARRRVLGDALRAAGLVNYPTEWWHWSHGDRYWALLTRAPGALYGPVDDR